jgi:predicted nucleic acid-binding protein
VIVIDTNVISELVKPRAEPSVVAWMDAQPADLLYTTAVTEAEILFGLAIMPAGRRQAILERAIEAMFSGLFAGRVLPFDRAAARCYATLATNSRRNGTPVAVADLQIAAIAVARSASAVATRNTRDFAGCGMSVIDPWEA